MVRRLKKNHCSDFCVGLGYCTIITFFNCISKNEMVEIGAEKDFFYFHKRKELTKRSAETGGILSSVLTTRRNWWPVSRSIDIRKEFRFFKKYSILQKKSEQGFFQTATYVYCGKLFLSFISNLGAGRRKKWKVGRKNPPPSKIKNKTGCLE